MKACEALAAEYTRNYVDINSIQDPEEDEERFGEAERARMTRDAEGLLARDGAIAGLSSDDEEEEEAALSDVD